MKNHPILSPVFATTSRIAVPALAALAMAFQAAPALAAGSNDSPSLCKRAVLREPTRFMASALLRYMSQDITIFLDQRIELAPTEDAALATYVRQLLTEYPKHSLVSVKVTLIPPTCYYESEA